MGTLSATTLEAGSNIALWNLDDVSGSHPLNRLSFS